MDTERTGRTERLWTDNKPSVKVEAGWYLRLLQKVKSEKQPVRTAGLQLQGEDSQGQHGSFQLQNSQRSKFPPQELQHQNTFNVFDI